jgi:hypothetical protein
MIVPSRLRRAAMTAGCAAALAIGALVTATPAGALAPAAPVPAAAPAASKPVVSQFDFENDTGGRIARFTATLRFISATQFRLSDPALYDLICDNRSVFATVTTQNHIFINGLAGVPPTPYTYKLTAGCHHNDVFANHVFTSPTNIDYVQIRLFAANTSGRSTVVASKKHFNPF